MFTAVRSTERSQMKWLQDPSQINGDNLSNVRREVRRNFRKRKREHLEDEINDFATRSTRRTLEKYTGIN
jgi:hypothetical protein